MKIIKENTDIDTGISTVTIQTKYGHFTGTAKCKPEDICSNYAGIRYATMRAHIKYCNYMKKRAKIQLETILNLKKDISFCGYKCPPKITKAINLKLRDYTAAVNLWEIHAELLEEQIQKLAEERDRILEQYKK